MDITKSKENLEILQTKTSDSSSKRVISLTYILKNVSENVSQKSISIEPKLEKNEKSKKINKYDELRADLNHLHLNLFSRKMSLDSFNMNLRPKLSIQLPCDYAFKKNLVSFSSFCTL